MTVKKHQPHSTFIFLAIVTLSTTEAGRTKEYFDLLQRRPLMLYECYRTGETIEPPYAVNLANLLDGTQPNNKQVLGTVWYEKRGNLDSYVTGAYTLLYNQTSGRGILQSTSLLADLEIVLPPYNGAAYYSKITITSQNNRVVYKVTDTSGDCLNAAALVYKTCYDTHEDCCKQQGPCKSKGVPLSRPRRDLGCAKLWFSRYPQQEPFPLCADYHSCT